MDKATVFGLLAGIGILIAALVMAQVPVAALLHPEALLVVFGGTITAVLISFSGRSLANARRALGGCFRSDELSTRDCVGYITEIAGFVRAEGILALQPLLDDVQIPYVRKGLQLLVDNRSERFVRDSLATDIEISYREDMDNARVFESAGGYAPTMGIIGAVIGLIHVVSNFENPASLAMGIAGAFSATLYGVALANLFLLPIAGKLRQKARDEWFRKTLLMEGLLSIQAGDHPIVTEEKLMSFISSVEPAASNGRPATEEAMVPQSDELLELI